MAMVLTLLPTMAFAATGMKTVYTNKNYKGGGSDGTEEKPFLNFEDALAAVQDGGTIIIDGTGYMNDSQNYDTPLAIEKNITIQAKGDKAEFQMRGGGLVLGANLTIKNIELSISNPVRPAIFVNGHDLTAENITIYSKAGKGEVYVFAGAPDGVSNVPTAGNNVNINLTKCKFTAIYAGGMGKQFDGSVNITLKGDCKVGGIYGGGTESISTPSTSNGATGAVNVTLNQFPSNLVIDGEGAGSFNVEATTTYPTTMTLKNVGQLTVTSGTVGLVANSAPKAVVLSSGTGLDLSAMNNPSIAELSGSGTLYLGKEGHLTVRNAAGTHTLEITSDNGRVLAEANHTYITQKDGNGTFKLLDECKLNGMEFNKNGTGWTTTAATVSSKDTLAKLEIDSASKTISKTVTEINDVKGAEVKVLIGENDSFQNVPLTITVNGNNAEYNSVLGTYVVGNMSLAANDISGDQQIPGVAYINIAKYNEDIAADKYTISVSAPKDGGGSERVSDTFTLTVTDGNTPPSEVKTLTGLCITKQPDKTIYTEDETFDPAGMEVTADYSDQSKKVLNASEYTFTPNAALTQDNKIIKISYTEGNITQTATVSITVNSKEQTPATITTAPTAKSNLVYNGTEQELINAGIATGGTLQYKLDGGSYSTALPKAKDAKNYTVYYKVVGDDQHSDSAEQTLSVTIDRKEVTVERGNYIVRKVYDKTTNAGTASGALAVTGILPADQANVTVKATPDAYFDPNVGVQMEMEAAIALDGMGKDNYKIKNDATRILVPCVITQAPHDNETAEGSAKYGAAGTVDLSGLIVPGGEADVQSKTDNDTVLNGEPTIPDGKTLHFAFKNSATANQSVTVMVLVPSRNYEDYKIAVTLTVSDKTVPTVTAPTAKKKLTYNGAEQALVTAGKTSGGELQYSLTSGSGYSTAIPVGKAAGNYTVYYKVVGNADLADVAENSIKVSIAKKDVTVAPKSVTIRRGNAIPTFELAYSGLVSGETLTPSVTPTFACNDNAGNPVSTSTAAGTYTITWTNMQDTNFSDANNYNVVKSATGTLTISTSSSGGSSSSSSSQTTKPTTNKTETTKNTDGSTTKTETKADGTLVKTTTEVNGTTTVIETKKDGTVTKKITNSDGSSVTTKTEPDGSTTTERRDENGSVGTETTDANGKTEIRTTLSENAVSNAKETASPVAAPISVQAEKNSISAPQIHITLPQDAEKTKVEISVSNVTSGTVAILVHEDGTEEILKTSLPTQNGLLIEATGNMTIKIVDNSKDFADTRNHWSREDVNFIASRNLFAGIGNGNFGTKEPMTRGMVNTVLARLNGIETEGGSLWYKNGNDWAQRNGISDGTNPTAAVTREQLATMLYRNAGSPKVIGTLTFADAHSASAYAQNALIWAQQNGILSGVGNHCVAPKATAERAQVAAMLARYLQNAD